MDEVTISVTAANIRKRLGRRRNPTYVFTEFFYHFSYVSTFNDALQIYISCEWSASYFYQFQMKHFILFWISNEALHLKTQRYETEEFYA